MKVVLFCGGLGTRLGELTEDVPKPLVKIGYRPILWHLMKYYAHYGHKDFILCLGYKADKIKDYFINYNEYISNDFTMSNGGRDIKVQNSDIADWKITFVDTGLRANIGQRRKAVEKYLEGEKTFLANYSDGLTDLPLPQMIDSFERSGKIGSFLCVKPPHSFHVVTLKNDNLINTIEYVRNTNTMINGGFFVFNKKFFDYLSDDDNCDLERGPLEKLTAEGELMVYIHDGLWACMDTYRDVVFLNKLWQNDEAFWKVWK